MKCPKCGAEMHRIGFAQLSGDRVFAELECSSCHYRIQKEMP